MMVSAAPAGRIPILARFRRCHRRRPRAIVIQLLSANTPLQEMFSRGGKPSG